MRRILAIAAGLPFLFSHPRHCLLNRLNALSGPRCIYSFVREGQRSAINFSFNPIFLWLDATPPPPRLFMPSGRRIQRHFIGGVDDGRQQTATADDYQEVIDTWQKRCSDDTANTTLARRLLLYKSSADGSWIKIKPAVEQSRHRPTNRRTNLVGAPANVDLLTAAPFYKGLLGHAHCPGNSTASKIFGF